MIKTKALTLEALRIIDEVGKRGSFTAAAAALGKVPSTITYTIRKLEEDLDVVLFDRSGHRVVFTPAGELLLKQGRRLLLDADRVTIEVTTLANGWEPKLTLVKEALIPITPLLPLVEKLYRQSETEVVILSEVLSGCWERLEQGLADIVLVPSVHFKSSAEVNIQKMSSDHLVYVAAPNHPIHQENDPSSEAVRQKYRGIAIADTAHFRPVETVLLTDHQSRLTVSTLEDKYQALLAGLGVGSMPYYAVEQDLKVGRLCQIGEFIEYEILMAWRRNTSGKAKNWFLRELPKIFKK